MSGLFPYHVVRFPLREFLADRMVSQAQAARELGINVYTFNHWVGSGRTPLTVYKALLQHLDPTSETTFAAPNRYSIARWASAKRFVTPEPTITLAAQWDARHNGLVLVAEDGEWIHVGDALGCLAHKAAAYNAEARSLTAFRDHSAVPMVSATGEAGEVPSASGTVSTAEVPTTPASAPTVAPPPTIASLPPESEVLLALLLEVHRERDEAIAAKAAIAARASSLEGEVVTLQGTVTTLEATVAKLEVDVADWMALAEERSAPPVPDHTAAVANVRAALVNKAPSLVTTLETILGNSTGSCR